MWLSRPTTSADKLSDLEMSSGHDQSSQELLSKLDELLKECPSLEERPGEQGHGVDYAMRLNESRKVSKSYRAVPTSIAMAT